MAPVARIFIVLPTDSGVIGFCLQAQFRRWLQTMLRTVYGDLWLSGDKRGRVCLLDLCVLGFYLSSTPSINLCALSDWKEEMANLFCCGV